MRPAAFALCLAFLVACDSDVDVQPATIQWLEWPAEVRVATPFNARAVLLPPVCFPHQFRPGLTADESAVTFEPYYLVKRTEPICPPTASSFAPLPALDTLFAVPGLAASITRTFEMRASTSVEGPELVVRTFGDVAVRLADPDTARRNAAGRVTLRVDEHGCARIQPGGLFNPGIEYVLEDQADTVGLSLAFVRGYLHEPVTPICGEARVFHLLTVN